MQDAERLRRLIDAAKNDRRVLKTVRRMADALAGIKRVRAEYAPGELMDPSNQAAIGKRTVPYEVELSRILDLEKLHVVFKIAEEGQDVDELLQWLAQHADEAAPHLPRRRWPFGG